MKWNLRILPNKDEEQAAQELKILRDEVAAAYNFFKANRNKLFQGKKKIPLYMIFGPERFGKTTILSQAGLDLVNADNQTMGTITPTKYCSFWFNKDAIYIDTAGIYTKPEGNKERHDIIWRGFIKLLQKYFGKNSIAGTLIVLDLPTVSQDRGLLKKTLSAISERIYQISSLVKHIHTHIVFTKCDRILGFNEFFAMLDPEERLQPFGISFSNNSNSDLTPFFEEKFKQLLEHLNNRVVESLQKSVTPEDRSLIKIFPSQMDQLHQTFIDVINIIPHSREILLSGVYFTSSIQEGAPINPIKNNLFNALNLKEKPGYELEAKNDSSFFVEEIFKKTINSPRNRKHQTKFNFLQPQIEHIYAFIVGALLVGLAGFVGYHSYNQNVATINEVKLSLISKDLNDPRDLHATINQLEQKPRSLWLTVGVNKTRHLYHALTKTHQTLLVQGLTSELENHLSDINNREHFDTQKLTHALKAYLMLGMPNKLDKTYLKDWFYCYWQTIISDPELRYNLEQQLTTSLKYKFKAGLNQHLVDSVRGRLINLPQDQLVYLLLENSYSRKNFKLSDKTSISKMYLGKNFHKVYDQSIPKITNNPPKYNWILGNLSYSDKLNPGPELTKQIRNTYLEKFADAWTAVLEQETRTEFNTIPEMSQHLNKISADNSGLIKILKEIKNNTNINNAPKELTEKINTKFPDLGTINLYQLQQNLTLFAINIQNIAQDENPNQAAFDTVIKFNNNTINNPIITFKNYANTKPLWLQESLQTIVANTWQALLDGTQEVINQAWDDTVVPAYNTALANKYPLYRNSKDNVNLAAFNHFFAPNGLMDIFFDQYLKPFVKTDKGNWSWKSIDGQKINFAANYLEVFLRASLIQKMFYPAKSSTPKISFVLTPIDMTPNTQNFSLKIDGQKISYNGENKEPQQLFWPGPQPGSVTMNFVNDLGKYFSSSEAGPWAWFRVLDKANITSRVNTKNFELIFDLNGNAVKYNLSTSESLNPFIPEIINNFRCMPNE